MPTTAHVKINAGGDITAKITLSYSAEAMAEFGIDIANKYPSNATVVLNVYNSSDVKVVDNVSMPYIAGTSGEYIVTATPSPVTVVNERYRWEILATSTEGKITPFSGFEKCVYEDGAC